MKIRLTLTLVLTLLCAAVFAQVESSLEILQSGRKIPRDITTLSSVKYKKDIQSISKKAKRKDAKTKESFFLESNFLLDDFLRSGNVLFDDPASKYITKVGQKILAQIPSSKRPKVRFYTVKSSVVNAFATNNGLVFVNAGLLARLENEAQLAFILAHEITHVTEGHNLELYVEKKKIEKENSSQIFNRGNDSNRNLMMQNHFSRELEFDADEGGVKLFLKTNYSLDAALSIFEILRKSDMPIENKKFDYSYFKDLGLQLPNQYMRNFDLKKDSSVVVEVVVEDEDDSNSTHPSISKRKAKIRKEISGKSSDSKMDFLVSEREFEKVKSLAVNSLFDYYLRDFDYYSLIYTAVSRLTEDQNASEEIEYKIGQALSAISKIKNEKNFSDYKIDIDDVKGNSKTVYSFVNSMKDEDATIIAICYLWKLVEKYPNNNKIERLANESVQDYIEHHHRDFKGISKDPSSEEKEYLSTDDFRKYALAETLENKDFKKALSKNKNIGKQRIKLEKNSYEYQDDFEKKTKRGKFALGQKKLIVVNPFYNAMNFKKKSDNQLFIKSEEKQKEFSDMVKDCASGNGIKVTLLDNENVKSGSSEMFKEQAILNDWFRQWMAAGDSQVVPHNQAEVDEITKKYGTDHVMLLGAISGRVRGSFLFEAILNYIWNIPWGVVRVFKRPHTSIIVSLVVNVKTGTLEMVKYESLKSDARGGAIEAHVYDAFYQVQKKSKK